MKAKILAAMLIAGFAANAAAYGSAGCGLGSMIFQDNDKTQVLAMTSNYASGSQSFGITFGTSNCDNRRLVDLYVQRQNFIEANYGDLSRDVAAGKGEFVRSLARLYGVKPENTPAFATLLQRHHGVIFASNSAHGAAEEIDRLAASI